MTALAEDVKAVLRADSALVEAGALPVGIGARAPQVVGAVRGLRASDWWLPGLRDRAGATLRGVSMEALRDDSAVAREARVVLMGGAPAMRALVAVGLARGTDGAAALVHLGPASASDGAFFEALELASRTGAPVLFVLDQPDLAGAPVAEPSRFDPVALAEAAGLRVDRVAADDPAAMREAVSAALDTGGAAVLLAVAPDS